jgi:hypothetical protein
MILKQGITGFGNVDIVTLEEVKVFLKNIKYPYMCSDVGAPEISTNYYRVNIYNKINGMNFDLLVNAVYYIIAGVTTESTWRELYFIDMPNDFIEQIQDNKIMILNNERLGSTVPDDELEILTKEEKRQIKYWKSKTYGEIIFNGYD